MKNIQSVSRALKLLDVILEEESIRVTDAATLLGVDRATACRLLQTLVTSGYAAQNGRKYVPSERLVRE